MNPDTDTPALVESTELVPAAAAHVYSLFKEADEGLVYHAYAHTVEVAGAAVKIAKKAGLSPADAAPVVTAAWLHDTGYLNDYADPVGESVRVATRFLQERGEEQETIDRITGLIRSVHTDQEPDGSEEQILHDANLTHVGNKQFFKWSDRVRLEWEMKCDLKLADEEWADRQLAYLTAVRFYTDWTRKKYEKRRTKHLTAVHQRLALLLGRERLPERLDKKDREVPTRGIETMFRTAYRTHISLSSIADSKANIMISINAILMSIIMSFISTRLQTDPWLIIPSASLLITCLIAIVFAILSARPKVTSKSFSLTEVRQSRTNILFFGNFTNMPLDDFNVGIQELMADSQMLYDNMIADIYSLGHVLQRKYRLLWISYSSFMGGLILSVILFALFFYLS